MTSTLTGIDMLSLSLLGSSCYQVGACVYSINIFTTIDKIDASNFILIGAIAVILTMALIDMHVLFLPCM